MRMLESFPFPYAIIRLSSTDETAQDRSKDTIQFHCFINEITRRKSKAETLLLPQNKEKLLIKTRYQLANPNPKAVDDSVSNDAEETH
jgi:hypothetical protein